MSRWRGGSGDQALAAVCVHSVSHGIHDAPASESCPIYLGSVVTGALWSQWFRFLEFFSGESGGDEWGLLFPTVSIIRGPLALKPNVSEAPFAGFEARVGGSLGEG